LRIYAITLSPIVRRRVRTGVSAEAIQCVSFDHEGVQIDDTVTLILSRLTDPIDALFPVRAVSVSLTSEAIILRISVAYFARI